MLRTVRENCSSFLVDLSHALMFFFSCSSSFPLCPPPYVSSPITRLNPNLCLMPLVLNLSTPISCISSLPLRPTCQWFKDGVKLTEKSHQINNKERTLTFKSASPDDNGLYYCCAKNAAGHICSNSNFTLNIIGVCVCVCDAINDSVLIHRDI